jgi:hypothetical protein
MSLLDTKFHRANENIPAKMVENSMYSLFHPKFILTTLGLKRIFRCNFSASVQAISAGD